jgi:hypothetical protein
MSAKNTPSIFMTPSKNTTTSQKLEGDLYSSINLEWDYIKRTCRLSMEDYIDTVLTLTK